MSIFYKTPVQPHIAGVSLKPILKFCTLNMLLNEISLKGNPVAKESDMKAHSCCYFDSNSVGHEIILQDICLYEKTTNISR